MEAIDFGDIESAVTAYLTTELAALGDTATVGPEVPPSSTTARPKRYVAVTRIGGARKDLVTDAANIDLHCYAPSDAYSLVRRVRALVEKLPGQTISGIPVYRVSEFAGPAKLPHPASSTPRYVFAVRIEYRGSAL